MGSWLWIFVFLILGFMLRGWFPQLAFWEG